MNEIAIIICFYKNDSLKYIKQMFSSLKTQSYKKFDIFVQMDGKCDDNVEQYLKELKKNSYIKYLGEREQNKGFAYSLNEIINAVLQEKRYKYIARMDSDDICTKDRIKKQYLFMQEHPSIGACGGWIEEFDTKKHTTQIIKYPEKDEQIKTQLVKRNPMAHVTVFFRADFFNKVGFYDETMLNEDYELWIRAISKKIELYNLQEVLVKVRVGDDFFNRRKNFKRALEVFKLKIEVTKMFSFGIKGYLYAFAHFMLFMSPNWVKYIVYKNFRG